MYAKIDNNQIKEIVPRPNWFDMEGNPVSDGTLVLQGIYPIVRDLSQFNVPPYKLVSENPLNEWEIHEPTEEDGSDGKVVVTYSHSFIDVVSYRAEIIATIDKIAEQERLKYITDGSGQGMTYKEKEKEADLYFSDTDPQPENYPFLAAEIGITANSLEGVALVVRGMRSQWAMVGPLIEKIRLGSKKAVSEATGETEEEILEAIYQIYTNITWPQVPEEQE